MDHNWSQLLILMNTLLFLFKGKLRSWHPKFPGEKPYSCLALKTAKARTSNATNEKFEYSFDILKAVILCTIY